MSDDLGMDIHRTILGYARTKGDEGRGFAKLNRAMYERLCAAMNVDPGERAIMILGIRVSTSDLIDDGDETVYFDMVPTEVKRRRAPQAEENDD